MNFDTDLEKKIVELADGILDELLMPGCEFTLDQRVDALKAIGTLHLGLAKQKGRGKVDEDETFGANVKDMRARVAAANGAK